MQGGESGNNGFRRGGENDQGYHGGEGGNGSGPPE